MITTSEINGISFSDGGVTVPVRDAAGALKGIPSKASGETYLTAGGGVRFVFCENLDLGFGMSSALTSDHYARELYRFEFRKRY